MDIISTQKYLVSSPRKIREVARLIKKLNPREAIDMLPFVGRRAYLPLKKVIATALANAKQTGVADETTLAFKEIQIGEGPRLKRWQAGARGRAKPYKRRMAHIRVVLTTKEVGLSRGIESKTKEISNEAVRSKIKNQKPNIQSKNAKRNYGKS